MPQIGNENGQLPERTWLEYITNSFAQALIGDRSADFLPDYETNAAGIAGSFAAGFFGIDLLKDISDLSYGIEHWEGTIGDYGNLALNTIGLLPFIGVIKNVAKSADDVVIIAAKYADDLSLNRINLPVYQQWCFAPETLVETPSGKRRIDEIREGEFVWAFDFASGHWVARVVQACHRSQYLGAVVEIKTEYGSVEATAYHPFWVLDGHDLENRPRPRELAEKEDEGLSVQGRWVNSHDLFAGDLLLTQDGRQLRVLATTQRYEESFAVCNLTIDTNHSFAVGNDGLLVHNTGGSGNWGIIGKNSDSQSIYKAPQPGKGQKLLNEGFHPEDFPSGGPYADGKAYFAKERALAEQYSGYGEGILEVEIPKSIYDARIKPYEMPYLSDPKFTEIPIPPSEFDVLNNAFRRLHDK